MANTLQSRFDGSPVHGFVRDSLVELARLGSNPWDPPDDEAADYVDGVRAIVGYVHTQLGVQDPQLVTRATLDQLSTQAGSLATDLGALNASRSLEGAQAAHRTAEVLLDSTRLLATAMSLRPVKVAEAVVALVRSEGEAAAATIASIAADAQPTLQQAASTLMPRFSN